LAQQGRRRIVVYRDYEERCTYVISRKIRRQPICGAPGMVKFWFMGISRRFDPRLGSYQTLGEKQDPVASKRAA
jgi:twinkle protein